MLMLCICAIPLQEGHPINLHHFGGIDLSKLEGKMSMERFWQTVLVNCEALPREVLPAATQAAGKPILGTCVVVDLSGFGYVLGAWSISRETRRLTHTPPAYLSIAASASSGR